MIESYLRERKKQRDILLMTHIVLGYPSFDGSLAIVDAMVEAGVDIMELQIPFSEPIADGPVILRANQEALARGATVDRCFDAARRITERHAIPFLFMSYYNLVQRPGLGAFVERMAGAGLKGAIVPDLPPEEGAEYLGAMRDATLDPIFIFSPWTTDARMKSIGAVAQGFVYCVARKGVTGSATTFSTELDAYLARCRTATDLPLAVGFGVKSRDDVGHLLGKVDIAVVGSETLRVIDTDGVGAVGRFVKSLRP
jgi:tryptophan synthase alpha chain